MNKRKLCVILVLFISLGIAKFSEASYSWEPLNGELVVPRHAFTAEALNGYVYIIGGGNSANPYGTNYVSKYDPDTDSCTLDPSMPTARHSLSSAVIDGWIYAVGGHVINSRSENERYNGTSWESKASVYARSGPGVAAFNGKLYVLGGHRYGTPLSRVDIYDPNTDTWSSGCDMPSATPPWRATTLGDKIYLTAGGHVNSRKVWCYDPVACTWDTSIPLMNVPRHQCELQAACGRIYAIGGSNTSDGVLSSVESWAPGEESWRMEPSLNVARWQFASAVIGCNIYVFGGYNNGNLASTEVLTIPEPVLVVEIDIKPGSCPNPVNVKSFGVLPVAILGTDDYDITTIDPTSIRLAGVEPLRSGYEDVAGPVWDSNDCNCIEDGPDGFLDLTLKFATQRIVEAIGDVNDGDVLVLTLTGVLFDPIPFETPIEGADCILIRGKHKPFNKADINKDGVVDNIDFAIIAENWLKSSIAQD